jgi:hypothetical protein
MLQLRTRATADSQLPAADTPPPTPDNHRQVFCCRAAFLQVNIGRGTIDPSPSDSTMVIMKLSL